MGSMADYFWLFAIAGGVLILGIALAYGVLRQKPLSASERDRQDRGVRSLYGNESRSDGARSPAAAGRRRSKIGPLVFALVFVVVGCTIGYYVATLSTAPSPSVEGKEDRNTQPAGPADKGALPGQQ